MSVYDCIREYENMGKKVFGNPRPPGIGPIPTPWHKFDATNLEKVIREVTIRHAERVEEADGNAMYPSHDDLCKTYVQLILYFINLTDFSIASLPLEPIKAAQLCLSFSAHMIAEKIIQESQ